MGRSRPKRGRVISWKNARPTQPRNEPVARRSVAPRQLPRIRAVAQQQARETRLCDPLKAQLLAGTKKRDSAFKTINFRPYRSEKCLLEPLASR